MTTFFIGNTGNNSQNTLDLNDDTGVFAVSLPPKVGGPQLFITDPVGFVSVDPYNQYCAMVCSHPFVLIYRLSNQPPSPIPLDFMVHSLVLQFFQ